MLNEYKIIQRKSGFTYCNQSCVYREREKERECVCVWVRERDWEMVEWLDVFHGISTFAGYLMSKAVYTYIKYIWFVKE